MRRDRWAARVTPLWVTAMPAERPPTARELAAWRCSCGFWADGLESLEDHLFTFPEDDHYELARDQEIAP